jgi:hypothetical protein
VTYLSFSFGKEFLEGNEMAFKKGMIYLSFSLGRNFWKETKMTFKKG